MPLIAFGIDKDRNLIIQFPVFVQPYTPKPLVLYQLDTVPILILDQNIKAHSCSHLCARAQLISQCVDTGQLNIPPQQRPIILSLTRVTPN